MNGRYSAVIFLIVLSLFSSFSAAAAAEEWVSVGSEQPGFHIMDVAVSGDGAYRAVAGDGGVLLLTAAGSEQWRSPEGRYRSVALSGDGDILVAGGDGILVRHKNGTVLATVSLRYFINEVAVSADGDRIAVAVEDETLRIYTATGTLLESVDTGDDLMSVSISPEGTYIAGGTDTGNVVVFSNTGEERWTYRLSREPVISIAMAESGRTIAAVSEDGAVALLSRAGVLLWKGKASHSGGVAVTADGNTGAVADLQGIRFIDRDGTPAGMIAEAGAPAAIAMDGDGTVVLSTDGTRINSFSAVQTVAPDVSVNSTSSAANSSQVVPRTAPVEGIPDNGEIPIPTQSPAPFLATMGGLLFGAWCAGAGRLHKK